MINMRNVSGVQVVIYFFEVFNQLLVSFPLGAIVRLLFPVAYKKAVFLIINIFVPFHFAISLYFISGYVIPLSE